MDTQNTQKHIDRMIGTEGLLRIQSYWMHKILSNLNNSDIQVVEWSDTHNINDYKETGAYKIIGVRTNQNDGLPTIINSNIDGFLFTLKSFKDNNEDITQFLILSDIYMRRAYKDENGLLSWSAWAKHQTITDIGFVSDKYTLDSQDNTKILDNTVGLDNIIDNGIYSGVYTGSGNYIITNDTDGYIQDQSSIENFVMIVLNNNSTSTNNNISQFKFAITNDGSFTLQKRRIGSSGNFLNWEEAIESTSGLPKGVEFGTNFVKVENGGKIEMLGNYTLQIGTGGRGERNSFIGSYTSLGHEVVISDGTYIGYGSLELGNNNTIMVGSDYFVVTNGGNETKIRYGFETSHSSLQLSNNGHISIGDNKYLHIGTGNYSGENICYLGYNTSVYSDVSIGTGVSIGENVNITNKEMSTPYYLYRINFPTINEEQGINDSAIYLGAHAVSSNYYRLVPDGNNAYSGFYVGVNNRETGEGFRAGGSESWDNDDGSYVDKVYQMYLTKDNIRFRLYEDYEEIESITQLPYGLIIEPSEDGSKLLFSYNGKTGEIQLT